MAHITGGIHVTITRVGPQEPANDVAPAEPPVKPSLRERIKALARLVCPTSSSSPPPPPA
jgi:hypothetical protein